jgi:hypothetical protein
MDGRSQQLVEHLVAIEKLAGTIEALRFPEVPAVTRYNLVVSDKLQLPIIQPSSENTKRICKRRVITHTILDLNPVSCAGRATGHSSREVRMVHSEGIRVTEGHGIDGIVRLHESRKPDQGWRPADHRS